MREIIFRGKVINENHPERNGEWVHGDLSIHKDGRTHIRCWEHGVYNAYEVDPATVGQFTGLCDKDGVKIYEGDIVKTECGVGYETQMYPSFPKKTQLCRIKVVKFCIGENYAYWEPLKPLFDDNFDIEYEVIGNIYE